MTPKSPSAGEQCRCRPEGNHCDRGPMAVAVWTFRSRGSAGGVDAGRLATAAGVNVVEDAVWARFESRRVAQPPRGTNGYW